MASRERRSFILIYVAVFGALSIVLSSIRVSFPLGNPNLGSTPVSIAAAASPGLAAFAVGLIKGLGVSLWTGQALIEIPAGIGDGMMGVLTSWLSRRINPVLAVAVGQLSRYFFTSGMIALSLTISKSYPGFLEAWIAMIPAITASIIVNLALSTAAVAGLRRFYPSVFRRP
ncbi:MAG: hypothetical protein NQU41_02110 [Candidatus Methanosuratincola sp.]|jgi:hypothetical protein|uniref:ECF transporter S component n=1 Tax=Methanosuratincola subterraneus TaxID=2593994 RepID=A0A3S3RZS4_METS7|nr:hypothetical protein [Candidatus Methanosuratincola sp.]RWX73260.1 MAG: hypothetical protein Metus_1234 [Candidatus Methanosuratincola subterraneus]